ncbi:MAG: DUF4124 domain-containing protein [Candidatus Binatia bacterium]
MDARWALVAALLVAAAPVRGVILEWRDADGVRHFTNRPDAVPSDLAAQVLIRDAAPPLAPAVAVEPAAAAPAGPVVASDITRLDEAYRAGLAAGLSAAAAREGVSLSGGGGGGAASGGSIQLVGPLAVADARAAQPAWGYEGWPGYFPFVTTGFDRGRSRHQTLRMLLQDQFQIDRGGPYAYARSDQPGLGPALAPFLPRGLPVSVRQYGRVLYR